MATFLYSVAAVATLLQGGPADTLGALRSRVAKDSGDGEAWFQLGQGYLRLSVLYHTHRRARGGGGGGAAVWPRAVPDPARGALAPAAARRPGPPPGGPARVARRSARGGRAVPHWGCGATS